MRELNLSEALEHIADLENSIRKARGNGVCCGQNVAVPAHFIGCGQTIDDARDVYRCTDCETPFHKVCAQKHFRDEHSIRAMEAEDIGFATNHQESVR